MRQHSVRVKVSGDLACFSRPEMKVERVSYEVITPSAARGILDAIFWKPEIRWHVRRIEVLKPIRFLALKRNEVQGKVPVQGGTGVKAWMEDPAKYTPMAAGAGSENATPRNTLALKDVAYIIEAEPLVLNPSGDNTPPKYLDQFNRRVKKGRCFNTPSFGCREFAARFDPPEPDDKPIEESRDLGMMLYDIIYDPSGKNNRPVFFKAQMKNGVVETSAEAVIPDEKVRREVLTCSSKP